MGVNKYRVSGQVTGSKYLGVFEANTPEEAEEIAIEQNGISLCHQCAGECEDPEITHAFAELIIDKPKKRKSK